MDTYKTATNPLVHKLRDFAPLSDDDCRALETLQVNARVVEARTDLIREGDKPSDVHLILDGFACRYKVLADGTRHIMAYLLPGDFCDLHVFILREMDHNLATLSRCTVAAVARARILELLERPAIARAMWIATLVDEATLREWLVNMAAREATERTAHLLCELLYRLKAVGHTRGDSYRMPLTQGDLADTMGLSSVHINRVLARLRREGLVTLESRELVILDVKRLIAFAGFTPNYLHLEQLHGGAPALGR